MDYKQRINNKIGEELEALAARGMAASQEGDKTSQNKYDYAYEKLSALIEPSKFMILGIKDFPINPNDLIHTWTEADNPYIFGSREYAQKFIDAVLKASAEKGSGDPFYHTIVELIS